MGKNYLLTVIISGAVDWGLIHFACFLRFFQVFYDNYMLLLKLGLVGGNFPRLHRELGIGTGIQESWFIVYYLGHHITMSLYLL